MAHTGSDWGGRRAAEWTAAVLAAYGGPGVARCWLQLDGCLGLATTGDHLLPRKDRPDLAYVVANGKPACRPCNSKRQGTPIHRLHQLGATRASTVDASAFFDG